MKASDRWDCMPPVWLGHILRLLASNRIHVAQRFPPEVRLHPPCLPRPNEGPPPGPGWIQDGFRIMARRDARGVRLFTRNGYNFAARFPRSPKQSLISLCGHA
jgi:ATP-dependent DNA ligase